MPPQKPKRQDTEQYSIRVVSRLSGISADTLRMWERRYGFPHPERRPNGNRIYSADAVERLVAIARALNAGYRPGEVVGLELDAVEKLLQQSAERKLPGQVDNPALQPLVETIASSDVSTLRTKLRQAIATLGPARFVTDLVSPLLLEIGRAWEAGVIDVRHEHLASEELTSHLRVLLASFDTNVGTRVVLATLPGEQHRLGLDMAALMLAVHGAAPKLLGANTPADQIVATARDVGAAAVGVSISMASDPIAAGGYVQWLRKELGADVELWLGGTNAPRVNTRAEGLHVITTWDDLKQNLERISR